MGRRIRWLALVLALCFVAVLAQLVNIQFRRATALNATATNPRNTAKRFDNDRGLILASDGSVLARSVPTGAPSGHYQYRRVYPTGPLYSDIVGYSSLFYGTSGAEYSYDTDLGLHKRTAQTLGQLLHTPGTTTDNVTLTVVPQLQRLAQQELSDVPDTNKDGAITVLSVKTAAVLAMYSSPDYTNNALATATPSKEEVAGKADSYVRDHEGFAAYPPMATFDAFAPGSTFKVVTSSAVYNLKPTLENFSFPVAGCTSPGAIPETTKMICNDATTPTAANPCGGTMTQMLPESCDPGYAELGLAVGATDLYKQAEAFGFDQTPPIDLAFPPGGVAKSNFPTPADLSPEGRLGLPGVALSAFGQETVTATDLQNAMVAEGIANKGVVMAPHVMAEIRNATGGLVQRYQPTVYKDAESAKAADSVSKLMQLVATTPAGTAYGVGFPPQWDIAVKTGTAQAGAGNTNTTDWMIGFAPAYDPVVAISVVVPLQARSASGAAIAGPIMKAMTTLALKLLLHSTKSTTAITTASASAATASGSVTTGPAATPTTAPPTATTTTTTTPTSTTPTSTTPTARTTLLPATTTARRPLPAGAAVTAEAMHTGRPPHAIARSSPRAGVRERRSTRPRLGAECSP
jgi:penicillin-binding protein A